MSMVSPHVSDRLGSDRAAERTAVTQLANAGKGRQWRGQARCIENDKQRTERHAQSGQPAGI